MKKKIIKNTNNNHLQKKINGIKNFHQLYQKNLVLQRKK